MNLEIFGRSNCKWCEMAKILASRHELPFIYRDFTREQGGLAELKRRAPGAKTVPQIFIGDRLIGGYDAFQALVAKGNLKSALEAQNNVPAQNSHR